MNNLPSSLSFCIDRAAEECCFATEWFVNHTNIKMIKGLNECDFFFSDTSEKLTEENKKLHIQFLEQKQQLEELNDRLKFYSRVRFQLNEKHTCLLPTAYFCIRTRVEHFYNYFIAIKQKKKALIPIRGENAEYQNQ